MYVHLGFQRPIAYKTVIELQIKEGRILKVIDQSAYYKQLREKNPWKDTSPASLDKKDIATFVNKSFSRKYEKKEHQL
jgi:hypothetical protein